MVGHTISHYTILEQLGEGGMGVVYKARDERLDRIVALKFLSGSTAMSPREVARFRQEAKALSALNHPHIATIYDFDEAGGKLFIVLEYLSAGTLRTMINEAASRHATVPIDDVVRYAMQLAGGLSHAHSRKIVHRDVKSDNVMMAEDGSVKITDFGLAKYRGAASVTKTGDRLGTTAYMSPEQLRGEEVDLRSDIFSLGIVLYELATLHLPFRGDHEPALAYSIVNEDPIPMRGFRDDIPDGLEKIIMKCLEKNMSDRYQSAEEIVQDLKSLRARDEVHVVSGKSSLLLGGVAILITALIAAVYLFTKPAEPTPDIRKTIAVLPFMNFSDNKEDEYFSDGITEDILTQLSKIADLKVISRTSIMQYKNTPKNVREIGKELNAGVVLEGSVRRSGNRIRIVGQLVDARNDQHVWAETYDREMEDVFDLQSDVARKIAAALHATLSADEKRQLGKKPTSVPEAYNYYLKGRDYYYRYRMQDNETAIGLFRKAIDLDPAYALAWAGLGDAYAQKFGRFGSEISWLDSAVAASRRAIELDESSAEAHKALANAYFYKGFYNQSLAGNLRAVGLDPNNYGAIGNIGVIHIFQGKLDEALPWLKRGLALAPTNPVQATNIGDVYRRLGLDREAEEWLTRALALQPDLGDANFNLALVYLLRGETERAVSQMSVSVAANSDDPRVLDNAGFVASWAGKFAIARQYYERSASKSSSSEAQIGLAFLLMKEGKQHEAKRLLDIAEEYLRRLIESGDESYEPRFRLAAIGAIRGNSAESHAWLLKAIESGYREYYLLQRHPWFGKALTAGQFGKSLLQLQTMIEGMRHTVKENEVME
ncbi:MAG: protein kinase [Bacteroidetes bacterium]|nr:protein kinase [Bacteroidota bacterium]MCW5895456.1 protein kinase [Bacteroidota bacterium]